MQTRNWDEYSTRGMAGFLQSSYPIGLFHLVKTTIAICFDGYINSIIFFNVYKEIDHIHDVCQTVKTYRSRMITILSQHLHLCNAICNGEVALKLTPYAMWRVEGNLKWIDIPSFSNVQD